MFRRIQVLFITLLCAIQVSAQNPGEDFSLSSIKAPSSPAFTILGIQPTEISSPKSYEALEASLLNNFLTEDSTPVIPSDYSLEFTPYWFSKGISYQDYLYPKPTQTLLQNLSFSIATLNTPSDSSLLNIGLGARTVLDFGSTNPEYIHIVNSNVDSLDKGQTTIVGFSSVVMNVLMGATNYNTLAAFREAVLNEAGIFLDNNSSDDINQKLFYILVNRYIKQSEQLFKNDNTTQGTLSKLLDSVLLESDIYVKEYASKISEAVKDRHGFKVEIATALKLRSDQGQFSGLTAPKFGIWLTPSYQIPDNSEWEFLGVLRYIRNEPDFTEILMLDEEVNLTNNWDFGFRLNYKKRMFAISGEFIYRRQKAKLDEMQNEGITISRTASKSDYKFDFSFSYNISDRVAISYTIGENFDLNTEATKSLMSVLSLNFGFGGPKKTDLTL